MPLMITPRKITPTIVPQTLPTPPIRLVPPMITAAITSSSHPFAVVAVPDMISDDCMTPLKRRKPGGDGQHRDLHARDVDAAEPGRFRVAADRIHRPSEPGVVHRQPCTAANAARNTIAGNGMPTR